MWACRLNVGDEVEVQVDSAELTVAGVIRGTATAKASRPDYGLQFVVEITVNPSWDQSLNYVKIYSLFIYFIGGVI